MKSAKYAFALLALAASSQASADTVYAWCEVQAAPIPSQPRGFRYHSGIIEFPDGPVAKDFENSEFATAFVSYVRSVYPGDRLGRPKCSVYETLLSAREGESMEASSELFVHTGWLGGRAMAVDRGPKVAPPSEELHLAIPGKVSSPATPEVPAKRKKTNAEADAEYAEKLADYNRRMKEVDKAVAEHARLEAERKRQLAESAEKARKARAEWQARVAACKAGDYSACSGATQQ
jgi:hypothetical protein